MSVNNVVSFVLACFVAIITLRLANPLWDAIFGLDWGFSTMATLTKYALMLIFGFIIFGIAFFIPFKIFTDVGERVGFGETQEEYYDGTN